MLHHFIGIILFNENQKPQLQIGAQTLTKNKGISVITYANVQVFNSQKTLNIPIAVLHILQILTNTKYPNVDLMLCTYWAQFIYLCE